MSIEQVQQIIDEITEFHPSLTLNIANEPLIAKAFEHCVRQVKGRGLVATFNTNGVALTEDIARLLVETQFDSVVVSVDAATADTLKKVRGIRDLDKLVWTIEMLLEIRGEKTLPRIGVSFVPQPANQHEMPKFIEYWGKKVDFIRITGFVDDDQPRVSGGSLPPRIPCQQLYQNIVIRANGDVSPCVVCTVNPKIVMGNVFRDGGVLAVWRGERLQHWRSLHDSGRWSELHPCHQCDYWVDSCGFKEEIRDGFLVRTSSPFTTFYNVIDRLKNWDRTVLHDRQGFSSGAPLPFSEDKNQ